MEHFNVFNPVYPFEYQFIDELPNNYIWKIIAKKGYQVRAFIDKKPVIVSCKFNHHCLLGFEKEVLQNSSSKTIGKAVGIGPCVKKLTSHHKEEKLDRPLLFCKIVFKEVVIGDGCDIGIGSIILPGIKIGEGSIIGAGSVVTKDVEPYTVICVNPARTLRKRED